MLAEKEPVTLLLISRHWHAYVNHCLCFDVPEVLKVKILSGKDNSTLIFVDTSETSPTLVFHV